MAITNLQARKAKPKAKDYKLSDEKGLYLLIRKNGSKYWRFKYRFCDKEKTLALGVYPEVTLKDAREKRDQARALLSKNVDPLEQKHAAKMAIQELNQNSFEAIAWEWFNKEKHLWAPKYIEKQSWILRDNLIPYIGAKPISTITAPMLLSALRKLECRGALETAKRSNQVAGQVFRYAIATGRAERDPSPDLKGALQTPKVKHFAAITDPKKVGPLLLTFEDYQGTATVRAALNLAPLVFVRPGELRKMEWSEIDFHSNEWRIDASKMKMRQPHIVPLSLQAQTILKDQQLLTGRWRYVFPCERSRHRPMSENAITGALRRLGISKEELTGHGFRAMARTLLDEELGFAAHLIEHQLAHEVRDAMGRAYNRTTHLKERKAMMQAWSDYLDQLKATARKRL